MKTNIARSGLVRLGVYLWDYKVTLQGKYLIAGLIMATSAGVASLDMPLYHLVCGLSALFLITFLAGLFLRPRIIIEGQLSSKTSAGHTIEGNFTVKNLSRLPVFSVSLGFFGLPVSIREVSDTRTVLDLKPGETASITVHLQPLKRGFYAMPGVKPYSTFPFNIFRTGPPVYNVGQLLVLPDFHPATDIDIPASRRYQPGGIALTSQVGESMEYIGNRDYLPGDSLSKIDFRSWGRLAKPVVREYQEEYYCRIALVLDTFVPSGTKFTPEGYPELEAAISLCATVADVLSRTEYIIDIFAAGPELYVFRAGRDTAHIENVLDILACLDACKTNPFEILAPSIVDELSNISTIMCVFLSWDESRMRLVREAAEVGCKVKILFVTRDDTHQSLADLEQWADSVSVYTPETIRKGSIEII